MLDLYLIYILNLSKKIGLTYCGDLTTVLLVRLLSITKIFSQNTW